MSIFAKITMKEGTNYLVYRPARTYKQFECDVIYKYPQSMVATNHGHMNEEVRFDYLNSVLCSQVGTFIQMRVDY